MEDSSERITPNKKSSLAEQPKEATATQETGADPAGFSSPGEGGGDAGKERKMDLLMDISLPVTIELGRTSMLIKEIVALQKGSIVEFDKMAGEPVDVLINGKKMAEGEVVVIEEQLAVRVTQLLASPDHMNSSKD